VENLVNPRISTTGERVGSRSRYKKLATQQRLGKGGRGRAERRPALGKASSRAPAGRGIQVRASEKKKRLQRNPEECGGNVIRMGKKMTNGAKGREWHKPSRSAVGRTDDVRMEKAENRNLVFRGGPFKGLHKKTLPAGKKKNTTQV